MGKERKEGKTGNVIIFYRILDGKEVGEHRDTVASRQKTDTEKFKTGLLLGFLDGKAYICSESLSGKIIFGEMEFNMIWKKGI